MSHFVENLSRVEEQVRSLQAKIEPFAERTEQLSRSVETLSEQVKGAGDDAAALVGELVGLRSEVESLLSTFGEVKTEGMQIDAAQEENRELHNSLTKMFGETFQVVSRFFETARKLGLCDKDQEPKFLDKNELQTITEAMAEPAPEEPIAESTPESAAEGPAPEVQKVTPESIEEESMPEEVAPEPTPEPEKPLVEDAGVVSEEVQPEEVAPEPEVAILQDVPADEVSEEFPGADFATEVPSPVSFAEEEVAMPELPDVASFAETLPAVDDEATDAEAESDETGESSPSMEEIAGQLDLPPLQLDATETTEATEPTAEEEQKIEDLLNDLSKPIST